ncbi:MAG: hypothetical protein QGG55_00640 [Verrucomicrobiota bacterium]|nr:hypothetical protein [Verrucomicrobiota bacterium]
MRKLIAIVLTIATLASGQESEPATGLLATFKAGEATDVVAAPNIMLYVPVGRPATPFLPPGRFTAVWEGALHIDLRGDYSFQAIGRGGMKLVVNNETLLDLPGISALGKPPTTKIVRLNKGANIIKVTYNSPARGDAQLRLLWSELPDKPLPHEPIRTSQLRQNVDPALAQADLRRIGRELFLEARCIRCHRGEGSLPELAMSGPSFGRIGDRRHVGWMIRWILDPKGQRGSARMPRMLHGATAMADSQAIATYLGTLKDTNRTTEKSSEPDLEAGTELIEKLNCAGCHNLPGTEAGKGKLNLDHINQKFPQGELASFLRAPNAHYEWTRMPKFKLTATDTSNIAQALRRKATALKPIVQRPSAEMVARGKGLVTTIGCLNCHSLKDENKFKAPDLAVLTPDKWSAGCLADKSSDDSRAPWYDFTADERAALRVFAATDRRSLNRHVPAEFAVRQVRLLNCNTCHGELEGFPPVGLLGGKLRPEWTEQLLAGTLNYRPRPWLEHRMPAFHARATELAHGLAMSHGLPPISPKEKPVNPELAKIGRKLAGVDGGFSCVACHGVKNRDPLQVFEAQGVNFARVGARIQPDYYLRWMLDPLRVDPQTRMPDYFDEDARSVLVDILEGDAKKQIEAIRQYLLQGNKMNPPVMQ